MLCLSRKFNESIVIECPGGEIIEIMVVDIRGDKVRLGIEAPANIPVNRREVHNAKKREKNRQEQATGTRVVDAG